MDVLSLVVSGRVSKVLGMREDRYGRDLFKFSMAHNRAVGNTQETTFFQVSVYLPLLEIVVSRGIYLGEGILVQTSAVDLAATIQGTQARPWLNIKAEAIQFLTNSHPLPIDREPGLLDRSDTSNVIDYNLLLALKGQRVG